MKNRGFVALMSAIIISSILLLVAVGGSLTGFYTRTNVVDAELKERSLAAADSCVDSAFVAFAQDQNYGGLEMRSLNALDRCQISAVTNLGTEVRFTVQATSSGIAITNLKIHYATSTFTVLEWVEVP